MNPLFIHMSLQITCQRDGLLSYIFQKEWLLILNIKFSLKEMIAKC